MTKPVQLNAATQLANLGEELNVPFLKCLSTTIPGKLHMVEFS